MRGIWKTNHQTETRQSSKHKQGVNYGDCHLSGLLMRPLLLFKRVQLTRGAQDWHDRSTDANRLLCIIRDASSI